MKYLSKMVENQTKRIYVYTYKFYEHNLVVFSYGVVPVQTIYKSYKGFKSYY